MTQIDQLSPIPKSSFYLEGEIVETTTDTQQALNPNKWLDSHGDYLFRYALVRVRDAGIAEDLVQETLLAAVGSYQTHAGRSSERTWLIGIMKHKVIDYFRVVAKNAQFQMMPADACDESEWFEESGPWQGHWREDRAPSNWPVHALESREFWGTFENCLSQLPPQMSIAFTPRESDGLTSTEICEILDVTPNNLWVLLHRSRAKLRQLLEVEWFHKLTPPPVNQKNSKSQSADRTTETRLSYRAAAP